ncbi:kinase-like domain-containing protein [Aspergillus transmontanensis]|uniref:Kinase-like domain-containing protein n=1 Tax=Aspergillus transmontanensis TaxID=1034304 RepID=A0A5N6WIK1_9EURO|nr:kinase-like domain-containing protein [Aspergillus transmontanensis]
MAGNSRVFDSTVDLIASAKLTPTEHLLLKGFLTEAVDPDHAAQYISQRIEESGDRKVEDIIQELKRDWKQLVMKFSRREDIPPKIADLVKSRDGLCCCLSEARDRVEAKNSALAEPAWIVPPSIFNDGQVDPQGPLFPLLSAFLTPTKISELQKTLCDRNELKNIWLLSPSIHSAFRHGHIRIVPLASAGRWTDIAEDEQENATTVEYIAVRMFPEEPTDLYFCDGTLFSGTTHIFTIETDNPHTHCLPSPLLFYVHHMIAFSLHLFFVEDCIAAGWALAPLFTWGKPAQQLMRKFWHLVPKLIRVRFYRIMSELGKYLYPSDGVLARRLPFGLYIKNCARSQQNEAVALRLVEEHTSAPAPLWVDDHEEDGNTTLIMTQVQGQTLDRVLHRLSYQEREQLSKDLKVFVRQIRCIPNHTPFRFANTFGDALYDHRVGGEFGPFAETSDFTTYLIPEHTSSETRNAITPVLSRPYKSFFSHADLHSTNILISQGRLSGVVDWECAGYFPEYWEFTKAIFGIINNEALERIMRDAFDEDYGDELDIERTLWRESPFGI